MLRKLLITFAIVNFGNIQTDVTIFIFASNNNIKMGRKGDINTRAIATRVPTELFVKLTMKAVENQQTMSALVSDILSRADAPSPPPKEKIVYQDRVVYQDKIVYRDGGVGNTVKNVLNEEMVKELRQKIEQLEAKNRQLSDEVLRLQKYDPALAKERQKKAREKEVEMYREMEKKQRANKPYYDKDGNVKYYDKDGNE
jgi:hypothetical protein